MEIIIPVVTFLLGYFAEKLMDNISAKFSNKYKISKNKKTKGNLGRQHPINAIFTEDIYPCILPENIWTKESGKNLFLSFPDKLRSHLKSVEGDFAKEDKFFCVPTIPGYPTEEVNSAIEIAREEIAVKFINREDGLYFNGDKLGIAFLDSKTRSTDIRETPQLFVELFRTDHFTHRVITRAIEILGLPKENISSETLNNELKWIRTSFGISVIIILKSTNQIIMTRRSKSASFSQGKNWIYVSVTEALSQTDTDEYESTIDLSLCVMRGIKEELGIDKGMYRHDDIKFYDCFFETQFYQDGIVSSIAISDDIMPQDIINFRAKDKLLEIEDIFFIDNTKTAIKKFISDNYSDMRSQTIFALESYLASL